MPQFTFCHYCFLVPQHNKHCRGCFIRYKKYKHSCRLQKYKQLHKCFVTSLLVGMSEYKKQAIDKSRFLYVLINYCFNQSSFIRYVSVFIIMQYYTCKTTTNAFRSSLQDCSRWIIMKANINKAQTHDYCSSMLSFCGQTRK